MTYIKWKDEVESYLVSLPQDEKQKIFSYFSEMYADKRDAGKSEAQIIEEFGAPYDVAKKILADSRDAGAQQGSPANISGGAQQGNAANVNVNININGGTDTQQGGKELPERHSPPADEQPDVFGEGLKLPVSESKKSDPARTVGAVLLNILFVVLSICFVSAAVAVIVDGFSYISAAIGALAASEAGAGDITLNIGYGIAVAGVGFMLLAGATAIIGCFRKTIKKFKGENK